MIYRYIGIGYYPGVPARDLDEAAFATLTTEQQATVKAGTLYRAEPESEPAQPAQPAEFVVAPPASEPVTHQE